MPLVMTCPAGTTSPNMDLNQGRPYRPGGSESELVSSFHRRCLRIGWVYALKQSDNFANLKFAALAVALLVLSMACLSLSLRSIPVGTAYAIWTGIGAVGAATLGILAFGAPATLTRLPCIALIVVGVLGLTLSAE